MKYGISVKIDVSKIDKARLFKGQKGTYLDATIFLDTENTSQFGDHGMVTQDVSKEERQQNVRGNILGNAKIFYTADGGGHQGGYSPPVPPQQQYQPPPQPGYDPNNRPSQGGGYQGQQAPQGSPRDGDTDDIPF